MKIGLVNEYFPPIAPGGAEWSLYQLAQALAQRGHEITVITPDYGGLPAEERRDGFTVRRFPYPVARGARGPIEAWKLGNPLFYAYSACWIHRIARGRALAVLHAQNKHSMPGTWLAARRLGIPALVTIRDTYPLCPFAICLQESDAVPPECDMWNQYGRCGREFYRRYVETPSWQRWLRFATRSILFQRFDHALRRGVLARMDGVVFISEGIRDVYATSPDLTIPRPEVIYNLPPPPDDLPSFDWSGRHRVDDLRGRRIVLYVGKQSLGKGTSDLLAAIPTVVSTAPDAVFLFVGRGNAEETVTADLRSHVVQWPHMPNPDVRSLMREVRVVVLPSATPEAQGRVLLEAMSVGVPVVATRVGGIPETVSEGQTGLLVDRHDVGGLACAICRLLTDDSLARGMGEKGRSWVYSRFDPEVSLDRLEALYRELGAVRQ